MNQDHQSDKKKRLANLLGWLEGDSENIQLMSDAIDAALDADQIDLARELLDRFREKAELTPAMMNLAGLVSLRAGKPSEAAEYFEKLIASGGDGLPTRFNLAWCHAIGNDNAAALALLDDQMVTQLPQAAALKVHMLHSEGEFEEAMATAQQLAIHHPNHAGLMAAMSVLALDVEDTALAREAAEKAGNHPDALTTLGTLALGDSNVDAARAMFQQALDQNPQNPRAWIGKGLTQLNDADKSGALADLDRGAEMFGDHVGSWIAAGWAYFLSGNHQTARERFQKALDYDDNFAESQGSMAVIEAVEGNMDIARKRTEIAMRLDRQCFSGAFAQSLILQSDGDPEKAAKIIDQALSVPIDADGKTISDMLIRMNTGVGQAGPSIH